MAEGQIDEKQLIGEWYRGDNLGYNLSLTLSADHTYTARWYGDAIGPDGNADYGSAVGSWKLESNRLVIAPTRETQDIRGDLETLELRIAEGKPTLWPTRYPRLPREFGFTKAMVFEREKDIEAGAKELAPISEEDRGPTTRECVMDTRSSGEKQARPVAKAKFTVPPGWCVHNGDDQLGERDGWVIVPETQNFRGRAAEILIDVTLYPLRAKDSRTQQGRAQWTVSTTREPDGKNRDRLLGVVRTIQTKQFGAARIYNFDRQDSGPRWEVYLFGKRSVVEVTLWTYGTIAPTSYVDVLEDVMKSVVLRED